MTEEPAARPPRTARSTDDEPLDAEQAEALSRAARDAVRQPADPRLEKSFAHLGLVPDVDAAPAPKRTRTSRAPAPPAAEPDRAAAPEPRPASESSQPQPAVVDLQPLLDAVAGAERSTDEIRRRLDVLTWMLAGVIALIGLLAIVLIVRGPS